MIVELSLLIQLHLQQLNLFILVLDFKLLDEVVLLDLFL